MEELKRTISRSYSEKVNMGNYETKDYFCSRNLELADIYTPGELNEFSEQLHKDCMMDVKRSISYDDEVKEVNTDFRVDKMQIIVDNMFERKPMNIEEFQDLSKKEKDFLNSCKKLFKRSTVGKETNEKTSQ